MFHPDPIDPRPIDPRPIDPRPHRPARAFGTTETAQAWNLAWFSAAGSNVFSNVPFVLVGGKWLPQFSNPDLMWKVLALATTFAGNLTILGRSQTSSWSSRRAGTARSGSGTTPASASR